MKRKLTSILLMSALLVGGASTFVSCKDYDGDQAAVTNANVKGLDELLQKKIIELTELQGKVGTQGESINALIDRVKKAEGDVEKLQALTWIEDYKAQIQAWAEANKDNELLEYLQGLKSEFPNYSDLVTTTELAEYCSSDTKAFRDAIEGSIDSLLAGYLGENAEFEDFEEFCKYVNGIPSMLDLYTQMLLQQLKVIEGRDSLLNSRIDSLVQSVNVDMVSNPIYGTFNTPFGVKNYVLAGFVGGEVKKVNVGGKVISTDGKLASSLDGGNLYLTINPAEVDATGWNIGKLVGRDGSYAPGYGDLILAADNTPVTTISTRASNELGGYVATPELEDAAAAKINIDKDALKDVAKNVLGKLRGQEALDITNAVYTIYNQFANAIDQYYAVKCQVKEKDAITKEVKTRTIVSDYNIAAVTIKPLSYTTNIGVVGEKVNIPSIPAFENLLGIEIKNISFGTVNTNEITAMQFAATPIGTTIPSPVADGIYDDGDKLTIIVDGDPIVFDYSERTGTTAPYTYSMKGDITSIISELNTNLSNAAQNVNSTLNSVKDAIAKAGKYYNKVAPKLNKVISKVNYVLDNANQLLQPIMLGVADGEAFRLSEVEAAPTVVKANGENAIVLAPTSYTLELLAPAYKKSIKVNGTELNTAELDGNTKTVVASLKSGKNEIVYEAVDFYGEKVSKKYYIEVR